MRCCLREMIRSELLPRTKRSLHVNSATSLLGVHLMSVIFLIEIQGARTISGPPV